MSGRRYTESDMKYLEKYYGIYPTETIAKKLNRSTVSIYRKAICMGLGSVRECTGGIPLSELTELVGVNHKTLHLIWIQRNGMPVTKINTHLTVVTEKNLFQFMQSHPGLWNASKCEEYFFADQEWFAEKLKADRAKKHPKTWNAWTEEEDRILLNMKYRGHTFEDIGKVVDRDRHTVRARYILLAKKRGKFNEETGSYELLKMTV